MMRAGIELVQLKVQTAEGADNSTSATGGNGTAEGSDNASGTTVQYENGASREGTVFDVYVRSNVGCCSRIYPVAYRKHVRESDERVYAKG